MVIDDNSDHGDPAPSSQEKSGHHSRKHSATAKVVSTISDALADDGIVDASELGEIMVSVLGETPVLSDADSISSL